MTRPSPAAQALLGATLLAQAGASGAWAVQAVAEPASAASGLPFRTAAAAELPSASQWLAVTAVLVVVLAAAVALLKRFGHRMPGGPLVRPTGGRRVKVVERTPLPPHGQLVVVDYGARRLLLAVGPGHAVCVRDDPREEAAT